MRVLVAGDYCERARVAQVVESENYGLLFNEVRPFIKNADLSIVNFEFPIVIGSSSPIHKYGSNLKGSRKSIDAIKYAGFNCCTLANNHILDQGEKCLLDTERLLQESGISTVGVGANLNEAEAILYKTIGSETIAIINCCEHEFSIATSKRAGANPLNPISQFYKIQEAKLNANYVLVIVHGGHEHFQLPSVRMQKVYRFFIDAGADAVVNHHQHCFSGSEIYHDKPIIYGLGNFCFDKDNKRNSIWNEGYMVALNFTKDYKLTFEYIPYIQCNEKPGVFMLRDNQAFYESLDKLNKTIANPAELQNALNTYYKECAKKYLSAFEPYSSKITRKFYHMGYLPSTLDEYRSLLLYNYIECESHLDKVRYALEHLKGE